MTTELTEALARIHADIRLAIADPGSVIPRNYLYEMPETIFDLHRLAAEIYAAGWKAGDYAAACRESRVRARERDARRGEQP